MSRIPKFIVVDGKRGKRWQAAEGVKDVGTKRTHGCESMKLGVHPKQIPRLQRMLADRGVRPTQFNPKTGDCVVQDRTHCNEIMRARGMRLQNAGYGDWAGRG